MACKIDIKNTINKSIENKVDFDFWGYSLSQAKNLTKFINDIWNTNILSYLQRDGRGSYQILKDESKIDEAVEIEYNKQLKAETKIAEIDREINERDLGIDEFGDSNPSYERVDYKNVSYQNSQFKPDNNDINTKYSIENENIKSGVEEVFNENPELANIGTIEQYSQYLDTIFPDSKVKDIVYHGTNEKFDKFDKTKLGIKTINKTNQLGFYFSDKQVAAIFNSLLPKDYYNATEEKLENLYKQYSERYGKTKAKEILDELVTRSYDKSKMFDRIYLPDSNFISAIINSKNPLIADTNEFAGGTRGDGQEIANTYKNKTKNNDSIILPALEDGGLGGEEFESDNYIVFEPEQIHILSSKADIQGFKDFVQGKQFQKLTAEEKAKTIEQSNTLFGLNTQNQEQLEFHLNTLNAVSQFLENAGIETRLISEFLSQDGNVVEGAIAAANFIEGTVDIIDDLEKGRAEAWNKLPEEAAHWWYRLLDKNSELKDALLTSALTDRKEEELRNSLYGETYKDGPKVIGKLALDSNGNVTSKPALSAIREEAIGQLIAEAIKRIETKNAAPEDYSFFKKFLEWINSIIDIFKTTNQDPFEVAAMKILSSDMSDLMTWEEYRKVNNIVNFADVLTEQSVAPVDYTLIEDIGFIGSTFMEDNYGNATSGYRFHFKDSNWVQKYGNSSPSFYTQQELDNWVSVNIKEHDIRQKQQIQEVRDNQIFFDRLLNKTFRKKSKFLPKTLRKYYDIIDAQNLNQLREWNISQELQQITKKLSEQEKKQIIETNGYTNIAPTLKVLPDLLKKYGRKTTPEIIKQEIEITNKLVKNEITKEQATELRQKLENKKKGNSIVLSEPIKIDGAKKQELSILNGIKEMIKLENPNLKSITAEEFVAEAHNWLETNYLLGFANENSYLSYRTDQTFRYLSDKQSNEDVDITNLTEEEIQRLPLSERQRIANIVGLTKQNPDVYHNKVSLRFNDMYHLKSGHFQKSPSAWGNLTYFYTGKNKWKDAVLLHEIQNDNIEFLREFKAEKVDLETSLGRYLQQLNIDLLDNITQIESGGKRIQKKIDITSKQTHIQLNYQLQQIKDLPLEQGLLQLKQNLNEKIELYKYDHSKNPEKAQEAIEKAYSKRRIFQDFQKRGGIKSLLTKEELQDLKNLLKRLNTEEVVGEAQWLHEENQFEPGFPSIRDLKQKKQDFKFKSIELQARITRELQKIYGDNAPLINLTAPAKPRTKSQIRQGVQRSQELNENVNWLLAYSEKKILDKLSKTIEESKKDYISARNATAAYNFNVQLSKITLEQWSTLVENYKYNLDLLNRLIDEQAQKDIKKESSDIADTANKEDLMLFETKKFDFLKQEALDKKAELEKNYGKIEEEVKQTLEIEMNYFTPLVHHLIQKHINQYGKDFPMYFSGYQITKLTQGNDRTAWIYAGKDEINIVQKNSFNFNNDTYIITKEGDSKYLPEGFYKNGEGISQQEYEKAYQQATERRAKEIKYEAAIQIGLLPRLDNLNNTEIETAIKKLNDYKKQSKQNLDRVINTIMNISNNKPIETGAIYNAMSQISGIKLIWQDKIDGLKGNTGGYLVDLTNYNYNVPILYGLQNNKLRDLTSIQFQKLTAEEKARTIEQVTKEHRSITALKDLAAKLAHRIGGKVEFQNHPNTDWKGYNQGMTSVLNEAYMTPDTPFHEILAHPIIRAIKNTKTISEEQFRKDVYEGKRILEYGDSILTGYSKYLKSQLPKTSRKIYDSLLKELETGRGKEVFEQVKRDYKYKNTNVIADYTDIRLQKEGIYKGHYNIYINGNYWGNEKTLEEAKNTVDRINKENSYTLEEQQEEAIVTLLGLMAADKLDAKKDATLISKLKELWKQISDFVKSLLKQDGIKIDELPITTTLNDLAEIMAYGNNKIILPGYKVEYSTPLGNKYDTLEEVNNEIRGLANANVEVDLSGIKIPDLTSQIENLKKQLKDFEYEIEPFNDFVDVYTTEGRLRNNEWTLKADGTEWYSGKENKTLTKDNYKGFVLQNRNKLLKISKERAKEIYYAKENNHNTATQKSRDSYAKLETELHFLENLGIKGFIEKNKEYEQSKEIIEQWKKENNIQYDPEEVYSRGQGFYSSIGAYSNLELDLLLKNLIQHIEDNKKADGEFTISAFTKPIDKRLKHIEGTGDRVRFVIYPKSNHIKWAAPTDVHSGSVWDAHEKVSKDKKSELLGVSFTKAPALSNINEVSPNLADIIDNLSHVHNELGIELTTNNFRIEYDDNIDYSTKKLIDNVNKILDDKYGKLVKPEIKKQGEGNWEVESKKFKEKEDAIKYVEDIIRENPDNPFNPSVFDITWKFSVGKQPKLTKVNTTSIESVKSKVLKKDIISHEVINKDRIRWLEENSIDGKYEEDSKNKWEKIEGRWYKVGEFGQNETLPSYTSQAETNLKVAALKEVARKYPRSLITSKVVPINPNLVDNSEIQYSKISSQESKSKIEKLFNNQTNEVSNVKPDVILPIGTSGSGKSTFIKSLPQENLVIIEPDAMRVEFTREEQINQKLQELINNKEIEKDCTGKLKAEKGLATSFVKGGKWKVIKDLKGYPTHKEGGVDLTIGKGGVSIKNGNTQFTAKYGLVIPKN